MAARFIPIQRNCSVPYSLVDTPLDSVTTPEGYAAFVDTVRALQGASAR